MRPRDPRRSPRALLALALGAGALAGCGSSPPLRTAGAPPPAPHAGESITSAPVHVAHTTLGAVGYRVLGSGPPLVLIMGSGNTMEGWDPAFVDTLARSHRVVTFDNAGIGRTQALPAPVTIGAMANQTSALITALGLGRPDVLGWSMGGTIAQALAVQHPDQVRRLVLCATLAGTGKALSPPPTPVTESPTGYATAILSTLFPDDQGTAADAYAAAIRRYPGRTAVRYSTVLAQSSALLRWLSGKDPAGPLITGLSAPTLVADGAVDALDPVSNDRQLAGLIPRAQLILYPDAGHAFLFQDAGEFVPRLEAFLAEAKAKAKAKAPPGA